MAVPLSDAEIEGARRFTERCLRLEREALFPEMVAQLQSAVAAMENAVRRLSLFERSHEELDFVVGNARALLARIEDAGLSLAPVDPRDPDPTREGVFQTHNCYRCQHGKRACVRGDPHRCEWPHARND
jgi:hypothetical protein